MSNKKLTYGGTKFEGIVVGLDGFEDVAATNGKSAYRKLQFGLKTNKNNVVYFELFGALGNEVGVKDANGLKSRVPSAMRNSLPEGYKLTWAVTMGLEQDESNKNIKKALVPYDAIEYISKNLKNDDSVFMIAGIDFSTYMKSGEMVQQRKYNPRIIYKKGEPINFDAEDFVEVSSFEQEIIVKDTRMNEELGKMFVNANIVKSDTEFVPTTFAIDLNENREFAEAFADNTAFGDFVKVLGRVLSGTEKVEKPIENNNAWGGKKPAGFDKDFANKRVNELRIDTADTSTHIPEMYTQQDFFKFNQGSNGLDDGLPNIENDDLPF